MEELFAYARLGAGGCPCFLEVDDLMTIMVKDERCDLRRASRAHYALAPPSLDDCPEFSFEGERAALAVLALSSGRSRITRARWSTSLHSA